MLFSSISFAQKDSANFYQDLLMTDEVKADMEADKANQEYQQNLSSAKENARNLLKKKASKLEIDVPKIERRAAPKKTSAEPAATTANLAPAPFGMFWQASIEAIKNMGIILTKIEQKDYVNTFSATHLAKDPQDFRQVDIAFGEDNQLWRIIAYGDFINDSPDASKVVKEYNKYVRLLNRKYGKQKEFFTPKITIKEKKVHVDGEDKIEIEKIVNPIGNPEFLKQLQSGEAVLYSTFEGDNIGAALAINVDGDGKSYIIIDYKNIKIMQEREDKALDIL